MAGPNRGFFSRRRREPFQDQERQGLLESLEQTRALIAQAYAGFNAVRDADLIESYVFEINALQSRYGYLLRRFKELEAGKTGEHSKATAISQRV